MRLPLNYTAAVLLCYAIIFYCGAAKAQVVFGSYLTWDYIEEWRIYKKRFLEILVTQSGSYQTEV